MSIFVPNQELVFFHSRWDQFSKWRLGCKILLLFLPPPKEQPQLFLTSDFSNTLFSSLMLDTFLLCFIRNWPGAPGHAQQDMSLIWGIRMPVIQQWLGRNLVFRNGLTGQQGFFCLEFQGLRITNSFFSYLFSSWRLGAGRWDIFSFLVMKSTQHSVCSWVELSLDLPQSFHRERKGFVSSINGVSTIFSFAFS